MRLIIISGISGAGKATVAKEFEDMGYYCVDNMPPTLIPKFIELCSSSNGKLDNVVFVADVRGGERVCEELSAELKDLNRAGYEYDLLFLEADDETIVRRYKMTRRSHPLSEGGDILEGLKKERGLLAQVKREASYIIDTSDLSVNDLKDRLRHLFGSGAGGAKMFITIESFGFKYGIPVDSDMVFDVRFLPNPFHCEELREHTGKEACVQDYVMNFEQSRTFLNKMADMLLYLIPLFEEEGKPQLNIGIGCTGGCHRSVTLAEKLCEVLGEHYPDIRLTHRDILKDSLHK
jgi:UPF0042 nucleotide-binding protein